ncbi:MAG: hypothetical protein WKF34_07000 [Pyrinomonadaceae bacterium]
MNRYLKSRILGLICLLIIVPVFVYGQVGFASADAIPLTSDETQWKIETLFTSTLIQNDIASVTLVNAATGDRIRVSDFVYYPGSIPGKVDGLEIPSVPLSRGGTYVLLITTIAKKANGQFDKFETGSTTFSIPAVEPTPGPPLSSTSARETILKPIKSKEKKDSDVYIAGEFTGARKSKPTYSLDVKIAPRFGSGKWDYSPFFNLNASTDPDADPDSVNFGIAVARSFPREYEAHNKWKLRLTSYYFSAAAKFEAEKDFDNVNLTFAPIVDFVVSSIPIAKKSTLTFTPFLGAEVGRNLKSPLRSAQGDGIARVVGGGHVLLDIPLKKIEGITFSADYTRRILLSRELRYKTNDDDTLSLVEFSTSPRQYFESKLEFGINKFPNPYIAYDFVELPPSFKFVNHRVKVGFSYKFKLSNK